MSESPVPDASAANRRIACVECRQQKVKCDARQHWPDPCSRCKRRRVACLLQSDFKRTSKRKRIEEMEQEVEALRKTLREAASTGRPVSAVLDGTLNSSSFNSPVPIQPVPIQPMPIQQPQNTSPPKHARTPSTDAAGTLASINSSLSRTAPPLHQQHQHIQPIAPAQNGLGVRTTTGLPSPVFAFNQGNTHADNTNGSPIIHTPHSTTSSTGNSSTNGHVCPRPFPLPEIESYECSEKAVDDFTLSPDSISTLYHEFAVHYHPYLPVVDISMGPEKIYTLSPPLFWTIMNVGSRRFRDGQMNLKLNEILKTILSELAILPVTRFASGAPGAPGFNVATAYGVQAFLLATFWPLPTSSLTADISFSCAGTAIISATRGGLHCPEYARDFTRVKVDNPIFPKINEQIRTWVTCNIVEQLVAAMFGLPSFTIFDSVVLNACSLESEIDIPPTIKYLLQVQHIEHEIELSLNTNIKDPLGLVNISERLSLIQLLSNKLNELEMAEDKAPERIPEICKLSLRITRLHLMTYYLLDTEEFTSLHLQKGIIQAYNSALSVLDFVDKKCRTDRDFPRYLPTVFVLSLWQASSMVNKLYHSEFAQYLDTNAGKILYQATISHVMRASLLKHDILFRAAEMMKQNWHVFDRLVNKYGGHYPAKIKIKSRRAASVFFDTLWTVREEAGIRSQAHPVLFQRVSDEEDETADVRPTRPPSQAPTPAPLTADMNINTNANANANTNTNANMQMDKADASNFAQPGSDLLAGDEWNDPATLWHNVDSLMYDLGFQHESLNLGMP